MMRKKPSAPPTRLSAGLFETKNTIHTQRLGLALQVLGHLRWGGGGPFHGWQVLASRGGDLPLPRGRLGSGGVGTWEGDLEENLRTNLH